MPDTHEVRYMSPEFLENHYPSATSSAWSMGLLMYEYMYGFHPFVNRDSKIMQSFIKRYPVIFPEKVEVPSEF